MNPGRGMNSGDVPDPWSRPEPSGAEGPRATEVPPQAISHPDHHIQGSAPGPSGLEEPWIDSALAQKLRPTGQRRIGVMVGAALILVAMVGAAIVVGQKHFGGRSTTEISVGLPVPPVTQPAVDWTVTAQDLAAAGDLSAESAESAEWSDEIQALGDYGFATVKYRTDGGRKAKSLLAGIDMVTGKATWTSHISNSDYCSLTGLLVYCFSDSDSGGADTLRWLKTGKVLTTESSLVGFGKTVESPVVFADTRKPGIAILDLYNA